MLAGDGTPDSCPADVSSLPDARAERRRAARSDGIFREPAQSPGQRIPPAPLPSPGANRRPIWPPGRWWPARSRTSTNSSASNERAGHEFARSSKLATSRDGTFSASPASRLGAWPWLRCWPAKRPCSPRGASGDRADQSGHQSAGPLRTASQAGDLPVHGRSSQPARHVRLQAGAGQARRPADSRRDRPRPALCLHPPRRPAAGARASSSPGTVSRGAELSEIIPAPGRGGRRV